MSAPLFTPGVWSVDRYGNVWSGETRVALCDSPSFDVDRGAPKNEREANARLIAAAPELYEALSAVCAWLENNMCGGDLRERSRVALAKARGES